jgi:hypothetical protein
MLKTSFAVCAMPDKSPLTRSQILALCETGDFDPLIGTLENFELDCKMQPYILTDDKGKRELAKDVSAFANAGGGVILLGVRTEASADHFAEEVVSVNPIAQSLVNPIQYNDILAAWIYPPVAGLSVTWKATTADATKGVVIIDISPQSPATKPFLIAKTLDGSKVVESVFGYAVRKGDASPPLGVKELQQHLNSGLTFDTSLDSRLGAIEAALEALVGNTHLQAQTQALATQLSGAIATALEHANFKDRRILLLTAQPTTKARLTTVFASTTGSLKNTVERPPILRRSGWSVKTADTAKIVQGNRQRSGRAGHSVQHSSR